MGLLNTLSFIAKHPLNKNYNNKLNSIWRFFSWQIGSRLVPGSVAVNFVNNSRLLVKTGMTGATMNIYTGLHEFEDMSFVLHFLRNSDVFIDVGANVGSYTVLAAAVVGAKCLSIEPIPNTFNSLLDNLHINNIYDKVDPLNIGIASKNGNLKFTAGLDTTNHAVTSSEHYVDTIDVPVKKLDDVIGNLQPSMIKIDVEGFETEVILGAEKVLSNDSLSAVIMEINPSGEHYGFNELTLHEKMLSNGFKPFSYSPFSRTFSLLESTNKNLGNTLYLRNIEQVEERIKNAHAFVVNKQKI